MLTSADSYRNFAVGAQAVFLVARRWAVAAGGRLDLRSISFENGQPPETLNTDGLYLVASVVYRLGSSTPAASGANR